MLQELCLCIFWSSLSFVPNTGWMMTERCLNWKGMKALLRQHRELQYASYLSPGEGAKISMSLLCHLSITATHVYSRVIWPGERIPIVPSPAENKIWMLLGVSAFFCFFLVQCQCYCGHIPMSSTCLLHPLHSQLSFGYSKVGVYLINRPLYIHTHQTWLDLPAWGTNICPSGILFWESLRLTDFDDLPVCVSFTAFLFIQLTKRCFFLFLCLSSYRQV